MTALHQLSGQYLQLWNEVDNPDFDLDSLELALDGLEGELTKKCENTAMYFQNLDGTANQIGDAIKRMQHRKKVIENKAARMRKYLYDNMKASDISKIECPEFVLSIKKNPKSVLIEDEDLIPAEFKTTIETIKIDKTAIKKAEGCPGAKIVQGDRLDIK